MRKIVFALILLVSAVFIACEEHEIQPNDDLTISDSYFTDGGEDEEEARDRLFTK